MPKWITCIKREEKEVKMDFDITKEPPTEAEIKAERIRLKKKIKVLNLFIVFIISIGTIAAGIVCLAFIKDIFDLLPFLKTNGGGSSCY